MSCLIFKSILKNGHETKEYECMLVFGVVIAIILLMIWLFLGTTLEQEANPETDPMTVEQNI